ncbi:hypothetical protein Q8F55_002805 [Vanrija albida]|uniref:Mating factor alpha n=1 Tax=Vanrija albida TaxID=181172 RepID=A0ABR3QAZ9_9TREE
MKLALAFTTLAALAAAAPLPVTERTSPPGPPLTPVVDGAPLAARDPQGSAASGGSSTGWNGNPNGSSAASRGGGGSAGWYWSYGSAPEAGVAKRGAEAEAADGPKGSWKAGNWAPLNRADGQHAAAQGVWVAGGKRADADTAGYKGHGAGKRRFIYGGNDPAGPFVPGLLPAVKRQGSAYGGGPANTNNGWHGTSGSSAPLGQAVPGTGTWYSSAPYAGIARDADPKAEADTGDVVTRDADSAVEARDAEPDAQPQGYAYGAGPANVNNGWHGTSGSSAAVGNPAAAVSWNWYGSAPYAGVARDAEGEGEGEGGAVEVGDAEAEDTVVEARDAAPQGHAVAYSAGAANVNSGWHGSASAPNGNAYAPAGWNWYGSAPEAAIARDVADGAAPAEA